MKIALLGPAHPFRGGIVHFNSRLALELQGRDNLNVDLFYWSKPYPEFLLPGSVRAFPAEESCLTFHQKGLRILSYTNPLTWAMLIMRIKRGRYDLFITHWVHPVHFPVFKTLFVGIRSLTKTKIGLLVHNSLPHESFPGDAFMSRSVLNMADHLVMHGQSEAERATRIGVHYEKMVTAFHPVSDQFALVSESRESIRLDLGLRSKVLLFFGFIRPYKGLDCLLAAFRTIAPKYPEVSLLIVGERFYDGDNEECKNDIFLQQLPSDNPVRLQIVWVDRYVANEEVGRYFSVADVFIAPYLSVTQSGPLNIAYAFDMPVIASDLPGFRECVGDGKSGYLFSAGNSADLAKKIELFIRKPIHADQVRHYRQQFSWDRYADMLLEGHAH
jgi:glycosyltransferase involved in cell wall biosynthesis